jgi:hypothetical protein
MGNPVGLPANILTGIPASPKKKNRRKREKRAACISPVSTVSTESSQKGSGTSVTVRGEGLHTTPFLRTPQFQQQQRQQQQGASISAAALVVLEKLTMQKQRPLVAEIDEECSPVEGGAAGFYTGVHELSPKVHFSTDEARLLALEKLVLNQQQQIEELKTVLARAQKSTPYKARIAFEDDTKTRLNALEQRSEDIESAIDVRLVALERNVRSSTSLSETVMEVKNKVAALADEGVSCRSRERQQ